MNGRISRPPEAPGRVKYVFCRSEYRREFIMDGLRSERMDIESLDTVLWRGRAARVLPGGKRLKKYS